MRIVIDMQGLQGPSRLRGIGRYTQALTKSIIQNDDKHEIILVLNGLFSETIESIRSDFDNLLPQENIRVWYAQGLVDSLVADNNWRRQTAELIRESFLASLNPDIVLVTTLLDGLGSDVVTSVGTLSLNIPTAVILYDLIPFIYCDLYMRNPDIEMWFERNLDHLRRSHKLLAISESSRQESIQYLGFSEENTVNISTASSDKFKPLNINIESEKELRIKYNLSRPFVMYTGGIDHRKNIEGLIRSYALLPESIRLQHQLVIVCEIDSDGIKQLETLAKEQGLEQNELAVTGYVSDEELVLLYNLCKLFVFPSWHEGFGLPVLEAMSCGCAVIGSNTSSIPEVIGRKDVLFDPHNDQSIADKLLHVLTDDIFREELEQYGLEQAKKFSWDRTAKKAIATLEQLHTEQQQKTTQITPTRRPKLAYVSPLPPERSGISDYSAELLPELSRHYDIDVIIAQDSVTNPWVNANCHIRNVGWFRNHSHNYDRVLYQFGNGSCHQHMFSLLEEIPGTVVLHDFYLSGIIYQMDIYGGIDNFWIKELYQAYGYNVVQKGFQSIDTSTDLDPADMIWKYPCNLSVLKNARGVIVHSESSRSLAKQWYPDDELKDWDVIPHLRSPAHKSDRSKARVALGLNDTDFIVCSFGIIGRMKLNHRLLESWLNSNLINESHCKLIFVGGFQDELYEDELLELIGDNELKKIHITGWVDKETYNDYLVAADVGVQLRGLSRGETPGSVLDCMNYSLPTIVNGNGSLAELPNDAVLKLPDEFNNQQLINAIEKIWQNDSYRNELGERARKTIETHHVPRICAEQYFATIENSYNNAVTDLHSLATELSRVEPIINSPEMLKQLSKNIALSTPPRLKTKQLFVDISELAQRDAKTGIQRVVRSILQELLINPPEGIHVEPVYATIYEGYRYARSFTLDFLNCPPDTLTDEPVEYHAGDVFLGLDLQGDVVFAQKDYYQKMRRHGVQVKFIVYDLLCILMPQHFVDGAKEGHQRWLEVVAESDGAICISKSVSDELDVWIKGYKPERIRPFDNSWFYLGADVDSSAPSQDLPVDASEVLDKLKKKTSFLMVGTIESRKGYKQVLEAFEQLWNENIDINLVIVGKQGWLVDELVEKVRQHPELNKRLYWLEGISDEYLEKVYAISTCLIAASEGEGFGLPLIEAAQYKLPIIARDIPVFKEVAGQYAYYFNNDNNASVLVGAVKGWLGLYEKGKYPESDEMPYLMWKQSAKFLLKEIV